MDNSNIQAQIAEAQKAEDLTGMGIPVEELVDTTNPSEVKTETETPSKSEVETEEVETKEDDEVEEKVETEDKEKEDEETDNQVTRRPAKNERPLKAAFSQIKELRGMMERIMAKLDNLPQTRQETKDAIESVDDTLQDILQEAEEKGADPEFIQKLISKTSEKVMRDLEKNGLLKKDLPQEIQEKLKLLDKLEKETRQKEEIAYFEKEWNDLLPTLQKQYPNAKANELSEAKKLMDELSHSKDYHKYELDYILYKNRDKFDTILKVAKSSKSGETNSKQIIEDPGELDLDPENMTPEKMKAYEMSKIASLDNKVEIMG